MNVTKIYGIIGKVLCGAAGAIIGYICGGVALAVAGIFLGAFLGYFLEKSFVNQILKN